MPWVPWIHVESDDTLTSATKELYKRTRNPLTRKLSDLTRLTSSVTLQYQWRLGRILFQRQCQRSSRVTL